MHLTGGVTRGASSMMPLPASITVSTWVPVVPSTVELTVGTREAGLLIMLEKKKKKKRRKTKEEKKKKKKTKERKREKEE